MSDQDDRGHHRHHETHAQEGQPKPPLWRTAHRSWWFWLGVILMLVAMGTYVMTMDESRQPGGKVIAPVPAAP